MSDLHTQRVAVVAGMGRAWTPRWLDGLNSTPQAIASTDLQRVDPHPSARTHEIDVRPAHGTF